jgi:6-phosphogluconolactonase
MADEGGGHGSADIHISPDGKFLYASHRLKKDGISIFKINSENGKLTKAGYQQTGIHPRNFNITPNGKYILVACRDSNRIEIYYRNGKTGMLTYTNKMIALSKPVCIQFLK